MTKYKPDQSDRDALAVAKVEGIDIYKSDDATWSWSDGAVGNYGFETKWHAARDAMIGLCRLEYVPTRGKRNEVYTLRDSCTCDAGGSAGCPVHDVAVKRKPHG